MSADQHPTHSTSQSDPFDDPEVRQAVQEAWRSITEFEREVGWTDDDQLALESTVARLRGQE